MGAALLSAIWLIRERARTSRKMSTLRARVADLNAALQRSEALLNLRDQRVVVWAERQQEARAHRHACRSKAARPKTAALSSPSAAG